MASIEMQLSGEPFAEAMGRDLGGYVRDYVCQEAVCSPSIYYDPEETNDAGAPKARVDLPGFSSGVESYEYSKQPMNNIAFESGAGTSLLFGPVLNPAGVNGAPALALARDWVQHLASESNATSRFVTGVVTDDNPLGWPGFWPTLQPFSSWDPTILPSRVGGCSISSDDNPGAAGALTCSIYECDYTTLHLPNRASQVTMNIDPGSSGFTDWKEALWTLNYLQGMHDLHENQITSVEESQLGRVGIPGNLVFAGIHPGVYLGSSDIEGFQAGNFIQILDNQAAQWLSALTTADGTTLGGFASVADALAYGPTSALRWFPESIGVTESADDSGFPRPTAYGISAAGSNLLDLAGLLGAYASAYSLTDQSNAQVGGSQPVRAYFDGDPLPAQNQTPDGEATLHDRALAMIRVLVVDMDRLHVDPKTSLFADESTVTAGVATRSAIMSTDVAAYTLLSLRTARRALDSELTLYSNTTPDAAGIPSPLDAFAMTPGVTFAQRLDQLIDALAGALYEHLTLADGSAFSGFDVAKMIPEDDATSLDAHSAAIRGLLVAYLTTGSVKYRDRAESVFRRLESVFYDPIARVYRATEGDHSATVTFTPRRFGLLQGALRDAYELIGVLPGNHATRALIENRIGRLNKLVLNGWDDRNDDQLVDWPGECTHVGAGPDGEPLGLGGLQMAERTLTGESGPLLGALSDGGSVPTYDREHDCVPNISAVGLPSALANSVTFSLTPSAVADAATASTDASRSDAGGAHR